jgi:hypothetical protein
MPLSVLLYSFDTLCNRQLSTQSEICSQLREELRALNTFVFLCASLSDKSLKPHPRRQASRSLPPLDHPKHPQRGFEAAKSSGSEASLCPLCCCVAPVVATSLRASFPPAENSCGLLGISVQLNALPHLGLSFTKHWWVVAGH